MKNAKFNSAARWAALSCIAVIAVFLLSGRVHAWTVSAFDKTSGTGFTQFNADSPEAAKELAMAGCKQKSTNSDCHVQKPGRAVAVVIATGELKSGAINWNYAQRTDPEAAAKFALQSCRKTAKNCQLKLADWDKGNTWAAVAMGDSGIGIAYGMDTQRDAERDAIALCERNTETKGSCNLRSNMLSSEHAWYAIAESDIRSGIGVSFESKQNAINLALEACTKTPGASPCKVTETVENTGPTAEPSSLKKIQAQIANDAKKPVAATPPSKIVPNDAACRPRGETVRCRSQCVNSECVVTYENGCKVRVTVQPKFNPFTNQWDNPAPSC